MFENLLVQSHLRIDLNGKHPFTLESKPNETMNVLELKVPNVMAGVALLRQFSAMGDLDQLFSNMNHLLTTVNTRIDVVFLNHTIARLGKDGSKSLKTKLLQSFPLEG
jgi:hypothetical protein